MRREWKPGDVALLLSDGSPITFFYKLDENDRPTDEVMFTSTAGFQHPASRLAPARKAVVIDPEDREQVKRLTARWAEQAERERDRSPFWSVDAMAAALREFANPTPPRIDEPGTWGVVEASCCHSDERRKWVRHEDDNWWPAEKYSHAEVMVQKGRDPRLPDCWDDLVDPVLVREGVAS